jgi:hypothetical protein
MASEKQRAAARRNVKTAQAGAERNSLDRSPTDGDAEEAEAAGAEAAQIGGRIAPLSDDPAREPLEEAGQGEAEGFEQAERALEDIAAHGDRHRFPDSDVGDPEDRESIEHGEADEPIPPDE